jgi:hypothetical protein
MRKRARPGTALELAGSAGAPGVIAASQIFRVCVRPESVVVLNRSNQELYTMARSACGSDFERPGDGLVAACDGTTVAMSECAEWAPSVTVLRPHLPPHLQPLPSAAVSLAVHNASYAAGCYCGSLVVDGVAVLGPSDSTIMSVCYGSELVFAARRNTIIAVGQTTSVVGTCPNMVYHVAASASIVAGATLEAVYIFDRWDGCSRVIEMPNTTGLVALDTRLLIATARDNSAVVTAANCGILKTLLEVPWGHLMSDAAGGAVVAGSDCVCFISCTAAPALPLSLTRATCPAAADMTQLAAQLGGSLEGHVITWATGVAEADFDLETETQAMCFCFMLSSTTAKQELAAAAQHCGWRLFRAAVYA